MNTEDNYFGSIKWDKDSPWEGTLTLANGKTVGVEFDVEESEEEAARNTLNFVIANEAEIRRKVAVALFEQFEDWIDDDIVTPEQLTLRIDLSAITFWEGKGHLFYYPNGNDEMFTDHVLSVWLDADGEIEEIGFDG